MDIDLLKRRIYKKIIIITAAFTFPASITLYKSHIAGKVSDPVTFLSANVPVYKASADKTDNAVKNVKKGPEKAVGLAVYKTYKNSPQIRQEALLKAVHYTGPKISRSRGSVMGPSGKETYYNMNMSGVVNIMRRIGNNDKYWVRSDGAKMLGDYIMVAANLQLRPRGSHVMTSIGPAVVADTGGFAAHNRTQIDIAVNW